MPIMGRENKYLVFNYDTIIYTFWIKKMLIGLTGGIASGKTTVANLFKELNIKIISADDIARQLTLAGTKEFVLIAAYFGQEYILANGQLNRHKLKTTIFADNDKRLWLEQLLHPRIITPFSLGLRPSFSPLKGHTALTGKLFFFYFLGYFKQIQVR